MQPTVHRLNYRILLFVLVLIFSMVSLNSCKKNSSGGCSDKVAPATFKIVSTTSGLSAPFVGVDTCYPGVVFTVKDADDIPVNDICVEISSDGFVALHTPGDLDCANVSTATSPDSLTATTDAYGNLSVDLVVQSGVAGETFFIDAASGGAQRVEIVTAASK